MRTTYFGFGVIQTIVTTLSDVSVNSDITAAILCVFPTASVYFRSFTFSIDDVLYRQRGNFWPGQATFRARKEQSVSLNALRPPVKYHMQA